MSSFGNAVHSVGVAPVGYVVQPRSRRDIERFANDVRRSLDIDPLLPLPGWELFERIGRYRVRAGKRSLSLSYGVEEALEGGALACATYSETEGEIALILSAESYHDLEVRNGGRARFSVCHEIGHAVLHADRLVQITRIDHDRRAMLRAEVTTPAYASSEWQANAFAAAFLAPGEGLVYLEKQGRLTVQALSRMYRVSGAMAGKRLATFRDHRSDLVNA
jgi:hypothetical protein